jgi:O-antigen ligase
MPTQGSLLTRVVWLSLLAFGLVFSLSRVRDARKILQQVNPYLLLFAALVLISAMWSIEPQTTVRRFIRVLTVVLDGIAFCVLDGRLTSYQRTLRPVVTALVLGSLIFVLVAPELAIEQSKQLTVVGAWRGLTTQKNALGSLSAITLIMWTHAWLTKDRPAWMSVPGMCLALLCLYKSRSSTAIIATVFTLPLLVAMLRSPRGLRRYMPYLTGSFAALLLVYSLAVLNLIPGSGILLSPVTTLTGKDLTFSNRTAIWAVIRDDVALHPVLGAGFGAYWVDVPGSPSQEMRRRLYFYPSEGHNGYMDVINELGVVGAVCLIAYLVKFLRQALRVFSLARAQGALYLALLFDQLIGNLFESHWFNVLNGEFVIMTVATVATAAALVTLGRQGQVNARTSTAASRRRPDSRSRVP